MSKKSLAGAVKKPSPKTSRKMIDKFMEANPKYIAKSIGASRAECRSAKYAPRVGRMSKKGPGRARRMNHSTVAITGVK